MGNLDGKGFPDVSLCEGISMSAKSVNIIKAPQVNGFTGVYDGTIDIEFPEYKGYSLTLGKFSPKNPGYKAKFKAPLNTFGNVKIPFKDFTSSYDKQTGDPVDTCKASPGNCPDSKILENMKQIAFWADTPGSFELEVQDVSAYGCTAKALGLATFDEAGSDIAAWLLTAAPLGLLVFLIMRVRIRPALVTPPLLG